MNGMVKNHSSKTLWVVETDTGKAVAHQLAPNKKSPSSVDADGVKAVDRTPIDGHRSWWKFRSISTADVKDKGKELTIDSWTSSKVQENEFGTVTYDSSTGWGVPI